MGAVALPSHAGTSPAQEPLAVTEGERVGAHAVLMSIPRKRVDGALPIDRRILGPKSLAKPGAGTLAGAPAPEGIDVLLRPVGVSVR